MKNYINGDEYKLKDEKIVEQRHVLVVFEPGTLVTTRLGGLKGMITAVIIKFEEVKYEVSYFASGNQLVIYMNEKEFIPDFSKPKLDIGFKG